MHREIEPFESRQVAGRRLAEELRGYRGRAGLVVLALPRGGVPVAFEVAKSLLAPLDVLVVRKLGLPGHEELAMGAIASGGVRVLNDSVVSGFGVSKTSIDRVAAREQVELERRERLYRGDRGPADVAGRTVILVDDGIATGATMRAAVTALRQMEPERIVVAVPTAAGDSVRQLTPLVDEVVCLATPEPYIAVGVWYHDFPQVEDDEVRELLASAAALAATAEQESPAPPGQRGRAR